ncbi:hypothetical protein D6C84_07596 [Aureobasidium pullulans]|uniref:C2H2-type domain-containing protein n=1 Tax=Aureobasidium pullulans TaxID=5580 RepID=A0A4S9XQ68_AURPU|nr:hypothetical protein D6C84_07596 [Aureobasidium pullulans]
MMNKQQLDALSFELCHQNNPHVMVVSYNNLDDETVTFHQSVGIAISAFYSLLLPAHHHFLHDGHYLAQWLERGEFDQPSYLVDTIMDDLSNIVDHGFRLISIYSQEEYNRLIIDSGVPAPPSEQTTTFADAPSHALIDAPIAYSPPIAWSSDGDMPSQNPVDVEDIVMFDHDTPPAGVPFMENGIYALMDENARARLWMPVDWQDPPLFAEPTPGPIPVPNPPAANPPAANPPAPTPAATSSNTPVENRDLNVPLDARRVFACNFPGCGKRLTRSSDLRRHWQNVHRGHTQT